MNARTLLLVAAAVAVAAPCRAAFSVNTAYRSGNAPDAPGHAVVDDGSLRGGVGAPNGPAIGILAPMAADSDGAKGGHADSATHSDKTSLMPGGQPLDANTICYVVLPLKEGWKCGEELKSVQLGDLVKISFQGKVIWGIAGDKGPADASKFGEASLACIKQLGQDPKGGNTGLEGQALYEFYPGSGGQAPPSSNEQIKQRLASLSGGQGGGRGGMVQQASGDAKPFSQCSGGATQEARRQTSTKGA